MDITEVRIFLRNEAKLKAYATVTFDNCFVVRNIKVIQGNNGFFIAMPNRKKPDGTYKDIAHPLNNETRQLLQDKIIDEYNKELEKQKAPDAPQEMSQDTPKEEKKEDLTEEIDKSIEQKFSS